MLKRFADFMPPSVPPLRAGARPDVRNQPANLLGRGRLRVTDFQDIYADALEGGIDREVDLLTSPDEPLLGDRAIYRAIYRSMEIHGCRESLRSTGHASTTSQVPC